MFEDMTDSTDEPPADALIGTVDDATALAVQRLLLRLAHDQDEVAAREAAQVPYWKPCPHHVIGLRAAANALRAAAQSIPVAAPYAAV